MAAHFTTFTAMLRNALGWGLAPGIQTFAEMFATDGVFETPCAPAGMARAARGRAAILRHLAELDELMPDQVARPVVRPVEGAWAVVLEYEARLRHGATGAPQQARRIAVIELREGWIALYREYWSPATASAVAANPEGAGPLSHGMLEVVR
jgi:hypothetical protein